MTMPKIRAKFESRCLECSIPVHVGDEVFWWKGVGVIHAYHNHVHRYAGIDANDGCKCGVCVDCGQHVKSEYHGINGFDCGHEADLDEDGQCFVDARKYTHLIPRVPTPVPPPCDHDYSFNSYCGADVCVKCDHQKGMSSCFCGWRHGNRDPVAAVMEQW